MYVVFLTGDKHGDFRKLRATLERAGTTRRDTLIILGDSGINYYTDGRSKRYKERAAALPIKLLCLHGNHEERAELLPNYLPSTLWGGKVLIEPEYPTIRFALDGEVYKIPTSKGPKNALVIGGAYSVDKYYRLQSGNNWYSSEQPSDEIKQKVEQIIKNRDYKIDIILSHTCPCQYIPYEWFISGIDQSTVDNSTEVWLGGVERSLKQYEAWYCGHYHGDKQVDKLRFLFEDVIVL